MTARNESAAARSGARGAGSSSRDESSDAKRRPDPREVQDMRPRRHHAQTAPVYAAPPGTAAADALEHALNRMVRGGAGGAS